jgi:hypothetical protein
MSWADAFTAEQISKRRARARLWAQANRARKRVNDRAWRRRNPEKVAAKNAV